jgi:gamma-glutamyltranspeptidase/glutathione hydrolase
LSLIAAKGRAGFYEGPVAEDIVTYLRALGGHHTLADFATAAGEYVEPLRTEYRGLEVCQIPVPIGNLIRAGSRGRVR